MKKAVILFSGGLDSTTTLAIAQKEGFDCYAITFDYGQRHHIEVNAAKRIATTLKIKHHVIALPANMFAPSALTHDAIDVPDYNEDGQIPATYIPARNTIFLAIALGYAESIGAQDIFTGACYMDYSGYPDCRPEFIDAFAKLANVATKAGAEGSGFHIHAPLMHLDKVTTIKLGLSLGIDYGLTVSCYQADPKTGAACGQCDSCTYRRKGFMKAGITDPTRYQNQ